MNGPSNMTRRRFHPPRVSLQVVMISVTLFCVFCGGLGRWVMYREEALEVSPEVANRILTRACTPLRIPTDATRVNVYAYSQGGEADFQISQRDFISWLIKRGWKVEHRTAPLPGPPLDFIIGPNTTRDGYYFSNSSHRGGWDAMYDVDLQRAWVSYSPR
jgi:hypothetical protein